MKKHVLFSAVCGILLLTAAVRSDEQSVLKEQLEKAKDRLAPTYTLAYKFSPGEEFRTKVIHLVTVETTIKGATQTAKTRSVSTKIWKITGVDEQGNITLVHSVDGVEMWQSVSGRQEIRYNSATDKTPPAGYEHVAKSVGVPLATVKMDKHGGVLSRENAQTQFNPGIGELSIPFPQQAVKVGATWSMPDEVQVRLDNMQIKKVQTRQLYKLVSVETGVATISVETQVLTPVSDPKIQSQLVQRLQRGTIKFDIDAGRLIHKQMDLDETVIGFNGPESLMQYLARFTEEPVAAEEVASKGGGEKK